MEFESFEDLGSSLGRQGQIPDRPVVCVQGLGFVGTAMAIAVAHARDERNEPCFNVIGVELQSSDGKAKAQALIDGRMPIANSDQKMHDALAEAMRTGNLIATTDPSAYSLAQVTVVDIHLDVSNNGLPTVDFSGLEAAISTLAQYMPTGSLIVVETTTPPGTCEKIVAPTIDASLKKRGLPEGSIGLAHAYERVMPGDAYLDSIINFWRVYAGHTTEAAEACESFLSQVINVSEYPLTRLSSTVASETSKVLENSYRAMNIAFMEEWGRFAEAVDIDLFEVVDAIRKRPTHSNLRQPGFGVGGYCLTKDPHLGDIGARELFELDNLSFPFSQQAIQVNNKMPIVSVNQVEALLGGDLTGKHILLLGVSYRQDVGDTRYGPSEVFLTHAQRRGAIVSCHDPLVRDWPELGLTLPEEIPAASNIEAVVLAVPHRAYQEMDFGPWLKDATPLFFDANNVLSRHQRKELRALGCRVASIGRGESCE